MSRGVIYGNGIGYFRVCFDHYPCTPLYVFYDFMKWWGLLLVLKLCRKTISLYYIPYTFTIRYGSWIEFIFGEVMKFISILLISNIWYDNLRHFVVERFFISTYLVKKIMRSQFNVNCFAVNCAFQMKNADFAIQFTTEVRSIGKDICVGVVVHTYHERGVD